MKTVSNPPAAPDASVQSVRRGMAVLRAFRSDRAPLSNAELVRRTGLPKATVSRLTSTLLHLGYIRHVPGAREFELAEAPVALGHAYLAHCALMRAANPFLQELADALDVSIALSVRDGLDMLYVGYRVSTRIRTLRLGVGSLPPLGATAIGRAWLWGLPAPERSVLLEQLRAQAGEAGLRLMRSIQASFDELRATGTCAVLGGHQRDTYGVALPVTLGRQRVLMSMSAARADMQPDLAAEHRRVTPVLRQAARTLEHLLTDCDERL